MLKKIAVLISFLLAAAASTPSFAEQPLSALRAIDNFYKQFLNYDRLKTPNLSHPELKFSKSFRAEVEKNKEICKEYSEGICGWQADNNKYLDAQESDPKLNYKNSSIKLREIAPNTIEVELYLFPFLPTEAERNGYKRTLIFKMAKENEEWVVDDIVYEKDGSSRKMMEEENAFYISHPAPGSKRPK